MQDVILPIAIPHGDVSLRSKTIVLVVKETLYVAMAAVDLRNLGQSWRLRVNPAMPHIAIATQDD